MDLCIVIIFVNWTDKLIDWLINLANRQQEAVAIQRTLMTGLAGGWWVLLNM